jgi:hypothetical protein
LLTARPSVARELGRRALLLTPFFVLTSLLPPARVRRGQVYHPNIDLDGNICLNILREDWKPVLSISSVVYGLQFLFLVGALSTHV